MKLPITNGEFDTNDLTDEQRTQLVEELQKNKVVDGQWVPKMGESYIYVDSHGNIMHTYWNGDPTGEYRLKMRNVFRTKEEAKAKKSYDEAVYTIKQDAEFWEGDWSDSGQVKWHGYCDCSNSKFDYGNNLLIKKPGIIYFKSPKAIKESQENHLAEWKIYAGVK